METSYFIQTLEERVFFCNSGMLWRFFLRRWAIENGLRFNLDKCKIICLRNYYIMQIQMTKLLV